MPQRTLFVLSAACLIAISIACQAGAPLTPVAPTAATVTPADGSTLKATAPTPQSPGNNLRLETFAAPTLTAGASTPTEGATIALQYRFRFLSAAGALLQDSGLLNSLSWTPTVNLDFDTQYLWEVRAESGSDVGPWSTRAAFISPNGGFIRGQEIFDPLTNGKTVGTQIGGHFVPGKGWQSDNLSDGIDYTIPTCGSCALEFDVTNFGRAEGAPYMADVKFISMGDGPTFGDFHAFRDHRWKMHLEQRADGDGTGMKLIWRNGDAGDGEPGDHTMKVDPAVNWRQGVIWHFQLTWNPSKFEVWIGELQPNGSLVNNREWFSDGFGGHAYMPPTHRISLGTRSRSETMIGAIWSNIRVRPN